MKLTYLAGSPEQKMLERYISATPFPTNTFFPWKLVAPRVHFPSKSEKTETTSPAFMSKNKERYYIRQTHPKVYSLVSRAKAGKGRTNIKKL